MRRYGLAALLLALACSPEDATPQAAPVAKPDDEAPPEAIEDDVDPPPEVEVEAAAGETEGDAELDAPVGEAGGDETSGAPEPETPSAPEDYGLLKYPDPAPAPEALSKQALAGYEVVTVYSKPDTESPKLGYLRIGARMKVADKVEGEGCKQGFYPLPTGGYGCASKGLTVDDSPPFMKYEPPPPAVDKPLPYAYGYVRKWNSPMWWRIPTTAEVAEAANLRAAREAERTGQPLVAEGETDTGTGGAVDDTGVEPPLPGEAEPAEPIKLPLSPSEPWLEKGYFVSLAGKETDSGRTFWRTARGAFVSAADVYGYEPKDFQGVPLAEDITFPVGFVSRKDAKLYTLGEDGKLKGAGKAERRQFYDLTDEVEVSGKAYMMTAGGQLVRKDHLVMPELQPIPKGLDPWDRWIDISLSGQILVAYEGSRPVYVTLVSSGRKGTPEESFETPKGRWRISSKHISTTMDGGTASDGNYSIQDVPWTMFFQGSYALHGAFWHASFGRVRSHGCVNLGPSDARWLFYWTTPFLPDGWHGVNANDDSPGTTVIIRD
ncbi:MAG: L,D-transpeptidase family protein [Myxococcales bacterium]|nr:L,D-transpeptidase family protein [Myxococcales bacterium]